MTENELPPKPRGPLDATVIPRFAGPVTFARLPRLDEVGPVQIGIVGVPFDSGTVYRPGARFGPAAVREGSRLLRPYHPGLDLEPFAVQQVADAGDITCTPFDISRALEEIEGAAGQLFQKCERLLAIGGDHTIALPLLRAVKARFGPVAVVHFDAHLDTWEGHFGTRYNHGTPFRRASEEGLLLLDRCVHVGTRGSIFSAKDLTDDKVLGFQVIDGESLETIGVKGAAQRIARRVGDAPTYISIDIDVLDPAHAPGTGTPEAGGMSSRELLLMLRRLVEINLVGADVVEVAPAYDHAEITAIAAANVAYELITLFGLSARSSNGKETHDEHTH
jgi:guanidinobutyrase / D-arginase